MWILTSVLSAFNLSACNGLFVEFSVVLPSLIESPQSGIDVLIAPKQVSPTWFFLSQLSPQAPLPLPLASLLRVIPGCALVDAESLHRWGAWWLELVWILPINTGLSGRCCHLATSYGNRSEGLVPELSLEFCASGLDGGQVVVF